ncbi:MAG: shikimate dehydrogenase [Desulfobacterales bacterium]|nr:shikimate dehydrogenase [Desulfobacterales bacterium]
MSPTHDKQFERTELNMEIDAQTSLYAVFGNPVGHSLSPVMHNKAFAETGFNGVYLAFRVIDIKAALYAVRAMDMKGISVTIPHKIAVMNLLDEIDDQSRRIGAVNTVINREGRLRGYNSDGQGAVRALMEKTKVSGAEIAVIGAGGAARAIGFGLIDQGARVTIINRGTEKGEGLAKDLGGDFKPLSGLGNISADILINTTPVGMVPRTEDMPLLPGLLRKDMLVMDIVYNPVQTALLKHARQTGCRTIDGVAMFVYQGAFQFTLWTGMEAPVETMRKTVYAALNAQADETGGIND